MTHQKSVDTWVKFYNYQLTTESQIMALVHLKVLRNAGDQAAGQALEQCLREFLK